MVAQSRPVGWLNHHRTGGSTTPGILTPGVVEYRLKIQSQKDTKAYFAFSGEAGLCRTTENGSVRQENLLKEIVSLPNNDIQAMISFFETNGFFFKVGSEL